MLKNNKHIEIVRSNTKGLSSMGQVSCNSILTVLAKHFTKVDVTVIDNLSDLEALVARRPDLVFLGMEFIPVDPILGLADPNRIWLSSFLDDYEIAYTGSSQAAHECGRNKPLAKQRILAADLPTSAFCVIKQSQSLEANAIPLAYPLFIKPTDRGGGLGIDKHSVVYNFEQLVSKVHSVTNKLRSDALIEEYLPGREFSVAILEDETPNGFLVMPIELVAPVDKNGARLLTGQIKSSNAERALEITDEVVRSKVITLAVDVFLALGGRDYGRIDIRLDAYGTPHFLEANLIPSLIGGYGSFPKACVLNIGLEYESMIMRIAELGLARSVNSSNQEIFEPIAMDNNDFSAIEVALEPI
jgi:D-alanine-D-alanine ligase